MLSSADKIEMETPLVEADQMAALTAAAGVETAMAIIAAFKNSNEELFEALTNQIRENDYLEAAKSAHALKGSAANLGAIALSETAREMEIACKEKCTADLEQKLQALQALMDATTTALEEVVNGI